MPSGENIAVRQQIDALRNAGIEVHEIFRYTDELSRKPLYKLRTAVKVATGFDEISLTPIIAQIDPDLIQVHNLHPNFGTRWISNARVPIVTTLHNFRASCANGLLFRDGNLCLECPTSGSKAAFFHGCFQESRIASLPIAISTRGGAEENPLLKHSKFIIAQSPKVHNFMIEQGIPSKKLKLIPGFVEQSHTTPSPCKYPARFVFVGRATPEKGLRELLDIWPSGYQLDVFGATRESTFRSIEKENVTFHGMQSREKIIEALPKYAALVFPGRVWEGAYPLVVREALEAALPIVALEGSSAADLIQTSGIGKTYQDRSDNGLLLALEDSINRSDELRKLAHAYFLNSLTESAWLAQTLATYSLARSSRETL